MYKIHIHKSLIKDTSSTLIQADISKVSDLISYINNFYPEILSNKIMLLSQEKQEFPESWIMKDEIPFNQEICYIVPFIAGKDAQALVASFSPQLFYRAVAGAVLTLALSAVISLIMPKPKNNINAGISDQDRNNNDSFDGIINTVDSSNSIPLNYGMLRVGGQIISADVNTINHGKGEQIKVVDYV